MTKKRLWLINILILSSLLLSLAVIWHLAAGRDKAVMMNCSSELYDHLQVGSDDAYLLVDLILQGKQVQLNYRYFDTQGSNLGTIAMEGELAQAIVDNRLYTMNMHKKHEDVSGGERQSPSHMQYISYISSLNLNDKGSHQLSVEVLERDNTNDYAIVLFQPSNTVCGCRLVQ
ncbi:hypothetical protein [Shewanella sp. GXUN23E]|uniref:hypothetical protein n=1 Tax=Shewanella sp. GXUN23E TaxID=3422498 RepID=UPI003D7C41CC